MGALGDSTWLRLTISGVPAWTTRPVRIFTFIYAGSCAGHDVVPTFALNDVVQADLMGNSNLFGPFTLLKSVPASLIELHSRAYAVVLRSSAADGNVDLFCGDLRTVTVRP